MVTFKSEKITEHLTRIHGITGELMYLAEGTKKAALIDTGSGIGSLRALVETLTDKPCIVLLTHGHVDHAMGAPEFDTEIYMNPADNAVHDEHSNLEFRKGSLQ
ncbi:MAG: MBL fold metallo-hydrolase, partial [Lachnospiraceae bacterium]|nr:MBL fold metallo-hydrolase [Lachnospiraceae bacterium]